MEEENNELTSRLVFQDKELTHLKDEQSKLKQNLLTNHREISKYK